MKLNTYERLILLNILPQQGDFTTLKIVRQLREALSFSEEEHKKLQIKIEDGKAKWLAEADFEKEIVIGEKAMDIIVEALKKLDKDKLLKDEHYTLYCKFIGG